MKREPADESHLQVLRGLPFVDAAKVRSRRPPAEQHREWHGQLELKTPTGRVELWIEAKGRVNAPVEATILELARRVPPRDWILFCGELPPNSARRLAEAGVSYIDQAGNCHVTVGRQYIAHVEGRKPEHRPSMGRGRPGRTEYVLLALFLTHPVAARMKLRELHELTGVSQSSLSYGMNALKRRGLLRGTGAQRTLVLPEAIDRWIVGYADVLRPALAPRRFTFADASPQEFEARAERVLSDAGIKHAWTGGAAAHRLTRYWHGETTTLHVDAPIAKVASLLRIVPKEDGPLVVLGSLAPFLYDHGPVPHVAPLPLVYAELLALGDERARDAARRLREERLAEWPT
jgi:hypothetical protein